MSSEPEDNMSGSKANLKILYERRERLRGELEAARARLDELETLIRLLSGDGPAPSEPAAPRKPRRGDIKETVLSLYEEAGEAGLSSAECVANAKAKHGLDFQAGSVSSLLSRLKSDGVLMYDGERYRLKRFAGPRSAA